MSTEDGPDAVRAALKAIDRAMTGDSDVLEVGCGTGVAAEQIDALPGVTLVAIDHSDDAVEAAVARGVDARWGDICYLPFDDGTFDVVYAGGMLHHVRDLDRALSEVRRVLRPGGTFVAVTEVDDGSTPGAGGTNGRRRSTRFSSDNGEFTLARRFSDVRRQDVETSTASVTVFEAR